MKKLLTITCLLMIVVISFIFINKLFEHKKYEDYNTKFTSLINQNTPERIKLTKIQNLLLGYIKSSSDNTLKEKAFYNYRGEFFNSLKKMEEKLPETEETSEQDLNKVNDELFKIGIKAKTSEGMIYLVENNSYSIQKFVPYLGKDWEDFYAIRKSENNELFDDGSLVITKEELRKRMLAWEAFLNKYSDFPENNEIKAKINCYIANYLMAPYDFSIENNKISSESIKSFSNFLEQNKGSKFYPIVKNWSDLLKKNNYKYDENFGKIASKNFYNVKKYNMGIFDGFSP